MSVSLTRSRAGARLGAWLLAVALPFAPACIDDQPRAEGVAARPLPDAGPTRTVACARPGAGCPCEVGRAPIDCVPKPVIVNGRNLCPVGLMYCRDGQWSACESVNTIGSGEQGGVGSAHLPLIGELEPCSGCDPDCGRAVDAPVDADLSPSNSSNIVYSASEGGITLPSRQARDGNYCAFAAPAELDYRSFCGGTSAATWTTTDATTGLLTEQCSGELAAGSFQAALCSCDDLSGPFELVTSSFTSAGAGADGELGHVRTNGVLMLDGLLEVGGELVAHGTGAHQLGGPATVSRDAYVNGPLTTGALLDVGTEAGALWVNGDAVWGGDTRVEGGAGELHILATASISASGTEDYTAVAEASIDIPAPCPCAPAELVDIESLVASVASANDNALLALDPGAFSGAGGSGTLTLPCGRFHLDSVDVAGDLEIVVTGKSSLFVTDDILTSGTLTITLSGPDAELDLFIGGTLQATGGFDLGDPSRPASTRIYVAGADTLDFSASGEFDANLYAPRACVTFDSQLVRGSLLVNCVDAASNRLEIIYDERSAGADQTCPAPQTGTYTRRYDAASHCGTNDEVRPDWRQFSFDAELAPGSELCFLFKTADLVIDLDAANPVEVCVPGTSSPFDTGQLLIAAGELPNLALLEVTVQFSSDGHDAPLLRSFAQEMSCGFTTEMNPPESWTCVAGIGCTQDCSDEAVACADGVDNDCDGFDDCNDSDCINSPTCCLGEICGDGISNDCDVLSDFDDPECLCGPEDCADGLDNDGDGATDCADTESCLLGACNAFGARCDASQSCTCPSGLVTEAACDDGTDDDCDGLTDCMDPDCLGQACNAGLSLCDALGACSCLLGDELGLCADGLDNDCDGQSDCTDSDCALDLSSCGCPASCDCMQAGCESGLGACTCAAACPCELSCAGLGLDCQLSCQSGAQCSLEATTAGALDAQCAPGSTCDATVSGALGAVSLVCDAATCELSCSLLSSCQVDCINGAACTLVCDGSSSCAFATCPSGSVLCPGGQLVCNSACP